MKGDNDRSIAVNITDESGEVKTYLPTRDFHNLETTGIDEVALRTLAPWWEKDAVCTGDQTGFTAYADDQNYLPGLINVDGVRSWIWKRTFSVRDRDLSVETGRFV